LSDKSKKVEKTFPEFIHGKHFMGCITMKEKSLTKQRKKPMSKEKNQNIHGYDWDYN
jgi:hypothetical protein